MDRPELHSPLFAPIPLRELALENRIVVSPMCQYSAVDGCPTDWHLAHLGQLALSGAGLLIAEATNVEARGRISLGCTGLYSDENEAAWKRVIDFCRAHGKAKLGLQIAHAGRKASARRPWEGMAGISDAVGGWEPVAPSAIAYGEQFRVPHALTHAELDAMTDTYVATARRAARLGFDLLELHCAHGYLLHEFLSPLSNQRTDQYGGTLDNRMRYPLEIFSALRVVWPAAKPFGVRVSATDWAQGGWSLEETVEFARRLQALGCDFIDVSSGGLAIDQQMQVGPGYNVPFAERIKRETGMTTIAVGMITQAEQAEKIIAEGKADMVALARGMLYNPRWAWHAAAKLHAQASYPPQYARAKPAV